MGEASKIQWTDHTFNPWRGCTHVSPGCEHCYAETLSKRNPAQLGTWGAGGTRVVASESYWRQPERWNREAEKAGTRARVFCASLADVFEDRPELYVPRMRLFSLIGATPHLDWLVLTKRPEKARQWMTPERLGTWAWKGAREVGAPEVWPLPNVWIGTTVEDQRRADERIPVLLDTPAAVRFLSCEPLLGPVNLWPWISPCTHPSRTGADTAPFDRFKEWICDGCGERTSDECGVIEPGHLIDWVIVGGESGAGARPMDIAWARSLVEQGSAAGVPVFVKQLGRRPTTWRGAIAANDDLLGITDRKGGDLDEWPADLRVREFPASAVPE